MVVLALETNGRLETAPTACKNRSSSIDEFNFWRLARGPHLIQRVRIAKHQICLMPGHTTNATTIKTIGSALLMSLDLQALCFIVADIGFGDGFELIEYGVQIFDKDHPGIALVVRQVFRAKILHKVAIKVV